MLIMRYDEGEFVAECSCGWRGKPSMCRGCAKTVSL